MDSTQSPEANIPPETPAPDGDNGLLPAESAPLQAPAIGANEAAVLDPAALKELRLMADGDTAFVARLINIFFKSAARHFADLRRAVDQHDAPALRRAAHSLKSNSRQFGATALAGLCRDLELQGRAGQFEGAAEKIAQAEAAYAIVRAALEQLL